MDEEVEQAWATIKNKSKLRDCPFCDGETAADEPVCKHCGESSETLIEQKIEAWGVMIFWTAALAAMAWFLFLS